MFDLDDYCKFKASDISDFWRYGREIEFDEKKLINLNDYVYSAFLLGKEDLISPEAVEKYIAYSSSAPYYGCKKKSHQLLPHTTAYSFGTLNILDAMGYKATEKVFSSMEFDTSKIIRPKSGLPHWPAKWAHHTWRVSHWIGGGPAILLNILRNAKKKEFGEGYILDVLAECDRRIIDDKSGLLRAYKSESLQSIFRFLYSFRHDPEVGNIGGLVHLHWVNYSMGRVFKSPQSLIDKCLRDTEKKPFLERYPYCLDFDYVQLLRVLSQQVKHREDEVASRIEEYEKDVFSFFQKPLPSQYSFHKLPGALAVLHEAALMRGSHEVLGIGIQPVDIIKKAYWL